MKLQLDTITITNDKSHHLSNNKPLYKQRFLQVLKFHPPGFAPVLDTDGAYHISLKGNAIYKQRYTRTFGFYNERATVVEIDNWFHILPTGERLYKESYQWCGNFQDMVCTVRNKDGKYFYIDLNGRLLCQQKYLYAGDFKDGIAVIQNEKGLYTHIYHNGQYVHNKWFYDLDVFHKEFARALDNNGWHHINKNGLSIYKEKYKMIEHFYNGFARVEDNNNQLLIIDENGAITNIIRRERT